VRIERRKPWAICLRSTPTCGVVVSTFGDDMAPPLNYKPMASLVLPREH